MPTAIDCAYGPPHARTCKSMPQVVTVTLVARIKRKRKPLSEKELANLRKVKPGQVINPLGINTSAVSREVKRLTQQQIEEIGGTLLHGSMADIEALAKDPNASALQSLLASVVSKAKNNGDVSTLEILLNRMAGKVPEHRIITGAGGGPIAYQNTARPVAEVEAELKAATAANGLVGDE